MREFSGQVSTQKKGPERVFLKNQLLKDILKIKKATEKEQILKDEDIQLLRNFIIKIQRELGL